MSNELGGVTPSSHSGQRARRVQVLDTAKGVIIGSRHQTHGDIHDTFPRIAKVWSEYLGTTIRPDQVAMCEILLKIIRQAHEPSHQDNYIDIAGYSAIAAELSAKSGSSVKSGSPNMPAPSALGTLKDVLKVDGLLSEDSFRETQERINEWKAKADGQT